MRRQFGKTLRGALALVCLVSTLALADEMTCTASDGKGNCTTATGPDGTSIVVVGEGLKVGEKMECVDRGTMIACQAVIIASPPPVTFEMTCTASDGKGNCTTATGADGTPVVVVGEGVKVGEKMDCVDRGTMIACQAI
jgi:recombinational DNA repair protein RecR